MKRPQKGSTTKQYAYANRRLGGGGGTKREMALLSGFANSTAKNAKNKIESTEGYQNAIIDLATKSNNLVLAILAEYQARGISDFSNKDLNGALNAISHAWEKFDKRRAPDQNRTPEGNPLRKVFMQRVENQTIINQPPIETQKITDVEITSTPQEEIDLDF